MSLVVALMYNLARSVAPASEDPPDARAELDSEETVMAVSAALAQLGHQVVRVEGDEDAYPQLRQTRPDIVFNLCEGTRGEAREAQIPALLELLGIRYTGSGPLSLALSLDKAAAKKHFCYDGVPTPRFVNVAPDEPICAGHLRYPLFVKPVREGSSMGIGPEAVCRNRAELEARVAYLHQAYRQPALVEEFLAGREFTVGLLGNGASLRALPIMEINFQPVPQSHGRVYSRQFKAEWDADCYYDCPARVDQALESLLVATAVRAFHSLGCRDVARVDLRLDDRGVPHVLEVNPLPGLTPGYSDLCRIAAVGGLDYAGLIGAILEAALHRHGLAPGVEHVAGHAKWDRGAARMGSRRRQLLHKPRCAR